MHPRSQPIQFPALRTYSVHPENHPERAIDVTAVDLSHAIRLGAIWLAVEPERIVVVEGLRSKGVA